MIGDFVSSIVVTFPGGQRVDASFDGQIVHTDQSREHGGEGLAPEPFSLFLASLATCAGLYVLGFCRARALSTEAVRVTQESTFDTGGHLQRVRLLVTLPHDFPEKYVSAVRAAAMGCKVKKTLASPPEVLVDAVRDSTGH